MCVESAPSVSRHLIVPVHCSLSLVQLLVWCSVGVDRSKLCASWWGALKTML